MNLDRLDMVVNEDSNQQRTLSTSTLNVGLLSNQNKNYDQIELNEDLLQQHIIETNNISSNINNNISHYHQKKKRSHSEMYSHQLLPILNSNGNTALLTSNESMDSDMSDSNNNSSSSAGTDKQITPPLPFVPISPSLGNDSIRKSTIIGVSEQHDEVMVDDDTTTENEHTEEEEDISDTEINLPMDIMELIFSQLSFVDRCNCAWVSSYWRSVLLIKPNSLLESCLISLHHPPPPVNRIPPPIFHIIQQLNITIAPCSCTQCYFSHTKYNILSSWVQFLKGVCFHQSLKKIVLRVFQNPPDIPPPSPSDLYTSYLQSPSLESPMPSPQPLISTVPYFSPTTSNTLSISSPGQQPTAISLNQPIQNFNNPTNNVFAGFLLPSIYQQQLLQQQHYQQQQQYNNNSYSIINTNANNNNISPLTQSTHPSNSQLYSTQQFLNSSTDFSDILIDGREFKFGNSFSNGSKKNQPQYLDLEKPLALPFNDRGALIPLSILFSFLNTENICNIKFRVCVDLPWSRCKELHQFQTIVNSEKISELGFQTYETSDTSWSSANKSTSNNNELIFTKLLTDPQKFCNVKRIYLITTIVDISLLQNLKIHLPNLSGLHLSVWNNNISTLLNDITKIFGKQLHELCLMFRSCLGIKYSHFSHTDRRIEDQMIESLVSQCPDLEYFSFEGWISTLSSRAFQYLSKLPLKHLVLKNGALYKPSNSMFTRLKQEPSDNPFESIQITESDIQSFISTQPKLKVFEFACPSIDKFSSTLSDNFINYIIESCPKIKYIKILDIHNSRSYIPGSKSKYHNRSKLFGFK
ncbi:hypothetical protein DLAC_08038 [Tieghemostelium lacteum]|uniref:F-box domain-containing protein n=1 Tax=Tieghemostelium lacteum TaxID=361077 RepID=A0A151ZB07_TIELA|nr:hypothetical protein DLAC_08038 [Tieghemostelium lacteum]|eukprot:KYQ91130.1 hypothetical protein DLAC_08038 [Tieghemostelium lacteum]